MSQTASVAKTIIEVLSKDEKFRNATKAAQIEAVGRVIAELGKDADVRRLLASAYAADLSAGVAA